MRLAHTQVCPALRYFEAMAPCTALSRSASSKTTNGALPPSSRPSFLMVGAHCAISTRPISVEPVKVSMRTRGLEVSSLPITLALPVMTLNTPLGMPARSASTARASAVNGVSEAGLHTTVQPTASAGATLRVIMAAGKFHGVMRQVGARQAEARGGAVRRRHGPPRQELPQGPDGPARLQGGGRAHPGALSGAPQGRGRGGGARRMGRCQVAGRPARAHQGAQIG